MLKRLGYKFITFERLNMMLKLTVNPQQETSAVHTFDKTEVTIGQQTSGNADLLLPNDNLAAEHVSIQTNDDGFTVVNLAKDPQVTVNSASFDTTDISPGDILTIGEINILFDVQIEEPEEKSEEGLDDFDVEAELEKLDSILHDEDREGLDTISDDLGAMDLDALFEEVMGTDAESARKAELAKKTQEQKPSAPVKETVVTEEVTEEAVTETASVGQPEEDTSHEDIVLEFRNEDEEELETPFSKLPKIIETVNEEEDSFDDDDDDSFSLDDYEDDVEDYEQYNDTFSQTEGTGTKTKSASRLVTVLVVILAMTSILTLGTYFTISSQNKKQEVKAAQGLADIAMALTHAHFAQPNPKGADWTDAEFVSEFVDENLSATLSSKYRAHSHVDTNGHLSRCPYTLGIHVDPGTLNFLLVAHPMPSLLQWLIPKNAIFIDSKSMQLHKTRNFSLFKRLPNRGASYSTNYSAADLTKLRRSGKTISLKSLSSGARFEEGFIPPKTLTAVCPRALTRIYNAPRYYRFGKMLFEAASRISPHATRDDIAVLTQCVSMFSRYPELVLYSYRGRDAAIHAHQALEEHSHDASFFVGFLDFNAENGLITNSHLLTEQEIATATSEESPSAAVAASPIQSKLSDELDDYIFTRLLELAHERRQALEAISAEILELVQRNNETQLLNFKQRQQQLWSTYDSVDLEQQENVRQAIAEMHQEVCDGEDAMSSNDFIALVKAAALVAYLPDSIKATSGSDNASPAPYRIEYLFKQIATARGLLELDELVQEAGSLATAETEPNSGDLLTLQNELRSKVLDKVGELLLSPAAQERDKSSFVPENRIILSRILSNAGIGEFEEREFFLGEFDLLVQKFKNSPSMSELAEKKSFHPISNRG